MERIQKNLPTAFEVILLINDIRLMRSKSEYWYTGTPVSFLINQLNMHLKFDQKMSHTVIIVGTCKCVTNAGKWIWGGHLPVGKSFAKKILEHCYQYNTVISTILTKCQYIVLKDTYHLDETFWKQIELLEVY